MVQVALEIIVDQVLAIGRITLLDRLSALCVSQSRFDSEVSQRVVFAYCTAAVRLVKEALECEVSSSGALSCSYKQGRLRCDPDVWIEPLLITAKQFYLQYFQCSAERTNHGDWPFSTPLHLCCVLVKFHQRFSNPQIKAIVQWVVQNHQLRRLLGCQSPHVCKLALRLYDQLLCFENVLPALLRSQIAQATLTQISHTGLNLERMEGSECDINRMLTRKILLCILAAANRVEGGGTCEPCEQTASKEGRDAKKPTAAHPFPDYDEQELVNLFFEHDSDLIRFLSRQMRLAVSQPAFRCTVAQLLACLCCHKLFAALLSKLGFDHLVLVDWLTSPETEFLEYLVGYLRCLCAEENYGIAAFVTTVDAADQLKCLSTLQLLTSTVERVNDRSLWPYNPAPLLRLLNRSCSRVAECISNADHDIIP